MATIDSGLSSSQVERETISAWYRRIGTGWRVMSRAKRQLLARMSAKARWELRRQRYGASGSRPLNYRRYRAARGMPPIGDDGLPVSDSLTKPTS